MKNKKVIWAIVGVLVLLLLVGGVYAMFVSSGKSNTSQEKISQGVDEEIVPTIAPDELGLEITPNASGTKIKFSIAKTAGIKSITYQLTWEAQSSEEAGLMVSRGTGSDSEIEIIQGKPYDSSFIDLGTCSSGRCVYDKGVKEVKLLLKITKTDDKIFQSEKILAL